MIRHVALVSENPQLHQELVERLRSAGVEVFCRPDLQRALPLLEDRRFSLAALILDSPRQYQARLMAQLASRNPRLPQLLFDAGDAVEGRDWHLETTPSLHAFGQPLTDPESARLIQQRLRPSLEPSPLKKAGAALDSPLHALPDLPHAPPATDSSLLKKAAAVPAAAGTKRPEKEAFLYSEEFLRRVGSANVPVLLHGETGAGKEVMARKLWSYSDRAAKPFLKLNCAALPSELIESELFGYEKGAFTGATMDKPGKFELAQNGTILLDEIGDMDFRLQAKLLQVLQDGEVQPLGSSRIVHVNVRVMAATHRDLRQAIAEGRFREDLYYRLSVVSLTIPPLRERREEILPLARQLLRRHLPENSEPPAITGPLERAMLDYPWPGNVRELENVMRRYLVYQNAEFLAAELIAPPSPVELGGGANRASGPLPDSTDGDGKIDYLAKASREAESKLLLEALMAVRWNRRKAAARLNIEYKAFLYKLQKHGIVESKTRRKPLGS